VAFDFGRLREKEVGIYQQSKKLKTKLIANGYLLIAVSGTLQARHLQAKVGPTPAKSARYLQGPRNTPVLRVLG
jgi:hypothetical protein